MAEQYAPIAKDESFNTTDLTPKNIADVLKDGLKNIADSVKPTADEIPFDNTGTSLSSDNVEDAIKEVDGKFNVTGYGINTTYVKGYVYKTGRVVYLTITDGSGSSHSADTVLTTLPSEYRPINTADFLSTYSKTRVKINTNGDIVTSEAVTNSYIRGSVTYISAT